MSETMKVLGQAYPAIATNTLLYTVPDKTRTVISTLISCNTAALALTLRVHVVPAGGSVAASNAIYYGTLIPASTTLTSTLGLTLGPGDTIWVWSAATNGVCFSAFGSEVSAT